jgi:hypothetical protein
MSASNKRERRRTRRPGMWATVQSAVLAGWGATLRLALIMIIVLAATVPIRVAAVAELIRIAR